MNNELKYAIYCKLTNIKIEETSFALKSRLKIVIVYLK